MTLLDMATRRRFIGHILIATFTEDGKMKLEKVQKTWQDIA